jgi:putative nucleotidyltransferase with HDIG domain
MGIFDTLIPQVVDLVSIPASPPHQYSLFEHTLRTVQAYHRLLGALVGDGDAFGEDGWLTTDALEVLGVFSAAIDAYYKEEITPGRSKKALAMFAALLHDIGKPLTVKTGDDGRLHFDRHAAVGADLAYEAAKRLQLSNAEGDWVRRVVRDHMRLLPFLDPGSPLDHRSMYRFFKGSGDAGVAVVLHTLADTLATYGTDLARERWVNTLNVARVCLSAWWEQHEVIVSPVPLLDGYDLQREFGLKPGKRLGRLIKRLIEEQASGVIGTIEEAHDFVRKHLDEGWSGDKDEH